MMRWMWFCLILLCGAARAAETAYTVRTTEVKAKPYSDAATLITLPQQSKVEVLARKAGWMQIKAGGKNGWVKMLSLKLGEMQAKSGDSGLRSLFNVAAKGSSGGTVTTGVRGLSEEDLKNARPNPQALQTMQGYAENKSDAQKFARSGNLKAQNLDYLPAPKGDSK